ncbi:hypothetical protein SDRG_00850 [Saprolegnia diclina VS20]|uniref:Uncharacterized protein n=1 Tax=Saprolegnia diclina (strain VS20) TaxID=1156394 RepID=T0S9Q7_SAPDV|nr:hypothetical protein SDRG_00850 [Saprolegnia diclina VS20]EQC42003.1 hypothetical protein SDRG_00850 [Saprolegnia diclina VS20]|eukprot:XP_008604572.1 hypothetical protein SDRG_00850 [Saprolegnia diclina VS20]
MIRGFYAQGLGDRPKDHHANKSSRAAKGPMPDFSLARNRSSVTDSVSSSVGTAGSNDENNKALEYSPSYRFDLTDMLTSVAKGVGTDDMIRLPSRMGILV